MNMKQLFRMALFSRISSILCLCLFFFSYSMDLEIRTQMLALSLSFTGWIIGSFFLGLYNTAQAAVLEHAIETAAGVALDNVKDLTDDEEKKSSHPLFKDDDNE